MNIASLRGLSMTNEETASLAKTQEAYQTLLLKGLLHQKVDVRVCIHHRPRRATEGTGLLFLPTGKILRTCCKLYNSHSAWTIIDQGGDCIACRIAVKEPMNMLQGWANQTPLLTP